MFLSFHFVYFSSFNSNYVHFVCLFFNFLFTHNIYIFITLFISTNPFSQSDFSLIFLLLVLLAMSLFVFHLVSLKFQLWQSWFIFSISFFYLLIIDNSFFTYSFFQVTLFRSLSFSLIYLLALSLLLFCLLTSNKFYGHFFFFQFSSLSFLLLFPFFHILFFLSLLFIFSLIFIYFCSLIYLLLSFSFSQFIFARSFLPFVFFLFN